jgi:putative ABC transport system ATP-binding protein
MGSNGYVLRVRDLAKDFKTGEVVVHALRGVNFDVARGELLSIIGPSGSGKSTLLGLIGGLDTATSGSVELDGVDITNMSERELTHVRNAKIGFVFQSFNLIPTLTARENVALPVQFASDRQFNPEKRAREVLTMLGLGDRLDHRPSQLSGGQQQRVAIARALANQPPLLLADEPTGNLDMESSQVVLDALRRVQAETGTTVIVVTHDMDIAAEADRVLLLVDGQLARDVDTRSSVQLDAIRQLQQKSQDGRYASREVSAPPANAV